MTIGFDLTKISPLPQPQRVKAPVIQPVIEEQHVESPHPHNPEMPTTLDEALHKPVDTTMVGEDGKPFQDKLSKNAPHIKRETWQIDKFTEPDGLPKDKNGNILIKAPPSTEEDRKAVNIK